MSNSGNRIINNSAVILTRRRYQRLLQLTSVGKFGRQNFMIATLTALVRKYDKELKTADGVIKALAGEYNALVDSHNNLADDYFELSLIFARSMKSSVPGNIEYLKSMAKLLTDTSSEGNGSYASDDIKAELYRTRCQLWNMIGVSEARKKRLAKLSYEDYLKTDEWHWLSEKAKEIQGRFCHWKKEHPGPFNVHHNNYPRRGEEDPARDLIVVCEDCHAKHHDKPIKRRYE